MRPVLSRLSLRTTLIVGVLLTGAVVAAVSAVGSAYAVRRLIVAGTLERHEALARHIAAQYEQFLGLHVQGMQMTATLALAQPRLDEKGLAPLLDRTRQSFPALQGIAIVDPQGRSLAASPAADDGNDAAGDDLSERSVWKELMLTRHPVIDKSIAIGRNGAPTVTIAVPLLNGSGHFRGAVTGTLDLAQVQSFAARLRLGRTGHVSVASSDGLLFAHPDPAQVRQDLSRLPVWALLAQDAGRITVYRDAAGQDRLAGFATVRPTGWKVWMNQELAEIDEGIVWAFVEALPWVLAVLGALILIAIVVAVIVSLAVRAMEANAAAIAEGDLGGRAPERGTREVVGLARTFNRMVGALRLRLASEREGKAALERALRDYGALAGRVAGGDLGARVAPAEEPELRELGWNLNRMATELERQVETLRRATSSEAAARAESERRRREVEAANRRVVQVLDSITDGFMTLDRDWRVLYANRRAEETIGRLRRSPDGLIGKVLWEEFPDFVGSIIQREYQRAVRDSVTVQFEFFYPPLGAWYELRGYPSPDGLSVYFQDITDRKRGDESLRESEERMRMAVDAGRMGTWEWRIDSGRVSWSAGLEAIHGLAPGTFAGTFEAVQREVHPDDRERVVQTIRDAAEQRKDLRVEYRIVRGDGSVRWVEGRGRLVGERHGRPERMVGLCMDITERKRVEEERGTLLASEQAARMEAQAANRTRDEFLAVLSHELRTPLNAILGWSRMLRFGSLDGGTVERAIETIERNAHLQTQLIDDLLDVSRIVGGNLKIDRRRVDLPAVLHAAVDSVRESAEAKTVALELLLDAGPGSVSGDPARLQQVFWNLLSNAIKFTPAGGRVRVALERREGWAEIRVSDTGAGIAPAVLPHVFDRFRQGEAGTTREYGGLGLGLAIVRYLVELHGGMVRPESEGEGRGSTFTVRLPLAPARDPAQPWLTTAAAEPAAAPAPALLQGIDVVLVDDDTDGRELLSTALARAGAWVRAVSSVAQAMAELDVRLPDVLVSDLAMPDEDGYALIRRVRSLSSERRRRLPAVAVSAHAREEDRRKAVDAGYDLHIAKPIDPTDFAQLIVKLISRAPQKQPA
jgi:PAS domain S-box-containing protein